MKCPECGANTEVSEKRGAYRTRRCTNPECAAEFVTCETPLAEHRRVCLRTLASSHEQQGYAIAPATRHTTAKSQAA